MIRLLSLWWMFMLKLSEASLVSRQSFTWRYKLSQWCHRNSVSVYTDSHLTSNISHLTCNQLTLMLYFYHITVSRNRDIQLCSRTTTSTTTSKTACGSQELILWSKMVPGQLINVAKCLFYVLCISFSHNITIGKLRSKTSINTVV